MFFTGRLVGSFSARVRTEPKNRFLLTTKIGSMGGRIRYFSILAAPRPDPFPSGSPVQPKRFRQNLRRDINAASPQKPRSAERVRRRAEGKLTAYSLLTALGHELAFGGATVQFNWTALFRDLRAASGQGSIEPDARKLPTYFKTWPSQLRSAWGEKDEDFPDFNCRACKRKMLVFCFFGFFFFLFFFFFFFFFFSFEDVIKKW